MNKEILRLAIPNIISNISVPLLSTVDTALMGRLSEFHIGAVGLGSMIFNFIYWNFGFLRMGTTGITAQFFGADDRKNIISTLGRALFISIILAILIMALQIPFLRLSINLMNVTADQGELLSTYFYIRIWAAPATLALYAFLGWFFGMQNAIFPLIITVFINLLNIVLSWYLVAHLEMDVAGVAWGTVIAQYGGLFLAIGLFWFNYRNQFDRLSFKMVSQIEALKKFLLINRDIFIRTVCLTFAFGFFYSMSSGQGDMVLAANVILLQFLNWMSYGIDGFAFASESLVGKYFGAKDYPKLKRSIRLSFIWAFVFALLFSLMYLFFDDKILSLFTDQQDVKAAVAPFLIWIILLPIISFACYIWDGVFIGLTASKSMRDCMLIALAIYLLSYYLLVGSYGNNGLWMALLIFLGARGIIQTAYYFKFGFNLK